MGAGVQAALLHVVQGNEVHVGHGPFQPVAQQGGLARRIIHPVDHGILIRDAPPRLLEIPAAGCEEGVHPRGPVDGHESAAGLVVGGVEGNGQREL